MGVYTILYSLWREDLEEKFAENIVEENTIEEIDSDEHSEGNFYFLSKELESDHCFSIFLYQKDVVA